jgi:hypothetical protein
LHSSTSAKNDCTIHKTTDEASAFGNIYEEKVKNSGTASKKSDTNIYEFTSGKLNKSEEPTVT